MFQSVAADEMTEREDWHVQKFESLSQSIETHRDEKIGASLPLWPVHAPQETDHKNFKNDCLVSPYGRVVGPLGFEPRTNGL